MSHLMKSFSIASAVCLVLMSGTVRAQENTVAGPWTLKVESFGLKLELEQKNKSVTGTLDWPHGDPIKLTGAMNGDRLTFTGGSSGENFTVHVDATATLKADDTLAGTIKAHFVDYNDAHEVRRQRDQEIPWTAERGLHGIVHFPR